MRRFGLFIAMAGALVAFTASPLLSPAAGAAGLSSPPTVGALQWSDMHAPATSSTVSNTLADVSCTSVDLLCRGGRAEPRCRWRDAHRTVERDLVERGPERERPVHVG